MVRKKINNRGYVLVEIILASALAFGVAYYMLNLTFKLKDKNTDLLVKTLAATDQAIIQNKLVNILQTEDNNFTCAKLVYDSDNKKILYNGTVIDALNKYAVFKSAAVCNKGNDVISIHIPLSVEFTNEEYDIKLKYVIRSMSR